MGGVLVTVIETTAKKKAQDALKESEERFRSLAEASNVLISLADPNLSATYYNMAWVEFTGLTMEDLLSFGWKQIMHPVDQEIFINNYSKALAEKSSIDGEFRVLNKDGKYRWLLSRITGRFHADGSLAGYVSSCIDITEIKQAQQELELTEQNLRNTILQVPVAMCLLRGPKHVVELANDKMYELWGKPAAVLLGRPIFEGLTEASGQGFESFLNGVYTTGETFSAETVPITLPRDNAVKMVYVNFVYKAYREPDGDVSGILAVAVDVTEQVLASKRIQENEDKLNIVIEASELGTWQLNLNTNAFNYSDKYTEMFGYPPGAQLAYEVVYRHVHPDDRDIHQKAVAKAPESGRLNYAVRILWNDNSVHWIETRAKVFYDQHQLPELMIGTIRDVTAERFYQQELEERDEQKDYFLSVVSHELKTPITSIKGYVQILGKMYQATGDSILTKAMSAVDKQVIKLNRLISDLLDLSKIKSENLLFNMASFTLTGLIKEVIIEIEHIYPGTSIHLQCTETINVVGDRERIGQVLTNFLTNAIKYSPDSKLINVECLRMNGITRVSVQDFGIGINMKDQQRIFERFYRVEGKNEKTFPGFGIGLFIAADIIQRHNGEIGVISEPGKGSTFYFSIPVAK